jgi:cell division protein FtsN
VLAGLGSYELGRNWVGRTLGEAISSENVQIKSRQPAGAAANGLAENSAPPPAQPQVDLEPRDPTDAEKQDLTAQGLSNSVAGGATPGADSKPAENATPAGPTGAYTVTAGSFASAAGAERVRSDLEQRGYQPTVTTVQRHGKTYHKVIVGSYDDKDQAESVRKAVEAAGYAAAVNGE